MGKTFIEERRQFKPERVPMRIPSAKAPLRVGVLFSGGPAEGGSNVVAGLFDGLKEMHPDSELVGFLGGPAGILDKKMKSLRKEEIDLYRNVGGFHLLGTGRTKIETEEQFQKSLEVIRELKLDGLVFIGGDDTNTNAFHLATYIKNEKCSIVGIPKTIDGDLKSKEIEISFGFDTACKVYSEIVGNIAFDALSSLKYWHFIKLMGRKASHVTLECALQTHPNLAFISEEVKTLEHIIDTIAETIQTRAASGKKYGVILIPEGLIEFIPKVFESLPKDVQKELQADLDPHGNIQVSKIETEKLLSQMVADRGVKFNAVHHFLGYEGRCAYPSVFDATYCYNLGLVAATHVHDRKTGVMAGLKGLAGPVASWKPIAVPLESMMVEEMRKGKKMKVIDKALVDLKGLVFAEFKKQRDRWRLEDSYQNPGPIQYSGGMKDRITRTLELESSK